MIDKIQHILNYYGYSSSQFANEIGIQRSAMSHILSGRNKPSLDFILKVLKRFPEINADWLLLGTGEMLRKETVKNDENMTETSNFNSFDENMNQEPENIEMTKEIVEEKKSSGLGKPEDNELEKIVFFFKSGKYKIYYP